MNNDVKINLRLPKALDEVLEELSKNMYGKVSKSRLIRLVLDDYVKRVGYFADSKMDYRP